MTQEIEFNVSSIFFWSDSTTVLNDVSSDSGRFHRFVVNRVSYICRHSMVSQWRHVPGIQNPADMLSRGVSVVDLCFDQGTRVSFP